MAGREPFTDPFFASEDPLCLSPEDDRRPPAREGSSDAGILRFPHRWTDPRCEAEHRASAGLLPILRKARTQETQNKLRLTLRGHGGSEAGA